MNRSSRLVASITGVAILFVGSGFLAIRYGGSLSTTLLGIIASILAPTLAALFAMVVVNPLREIKAVALDTQAGMNANANALHEVKELVNGQMTALREELKRLNSNNAALSAENQALADAKKHEET
jgi:hypothetical protein